MDDLETWIERGRAISKDRFDDCKLWTISNEYGSKIKRGLITGCAFDILDCERLTLLSRKSQIETENWRGLTNNRNDACRSCRSRIKHLKMHVSLRLPSHSIWTRQYRSDRIPTVISRRSIVTDFVVVMNNGRTSTCRREWAFTLCGASVWCMTIRFNVEIELTVVHYLKNLWSSRNYSGKLRIIVIIKEFIFGKLRIIVELGFEWSRHLRSSLVLWFFFDISLLLKKWPTTFEQSNARRTTTTSRQVPMWTRMNRIHDVP